MFYKYAVSKNLDVTVKPSTTLDGFTDAKKVDSWARTAVKWAVERGIISGKGNASAGYRIAPTEKATRVECAAMMNKFSEVYSGAPKMGDEDLEEPLALPEENIEDLPLPADETEDVIIDDEEEAEDNDVPSENEKDTDEGEMNPEEELAEDIVK
ncbi:MAG: S-layer homology domain-containing protein [Lachnospiraceae bacterium]|nr:S-layer homology domain-containing protein [Lachnospiraceae bacterium]